MVLNTPHVQKRAIETAASSGVRRPWRTRSTSLRHPVPAHRREFERFAVGEPVRLSEESQRVLHAVPLDPSLARTLPRFREVGADVDRQPDVGRLQFLDERHDVIRIVEHCCDGRGVGHRADHRIEVAAGVAAPVNCRADAF